MLALVAGPSLAALGALVALLARRTGVALEALRAGRALVALQTDRAHLSARPFKALGRGEGEGRSCHKLQHTMGTKN